MKLTLDWLGDFVDLPTRDPGQIAAALDSLGLKVESWDPILHRFSDVVIGRVVEVRPHPNADKVRLTRVDIGSEVLDIVCGAWNFGEGAVVPVAVPGAVIQGDFAIGERAIRGITSYGMICSEKELELGEDAAGIMVLDGDYPDAADRLGEPFASLLPVADVVFDIEVTPNRPDAMSVYGIARELAAFFDVPLRRPEFPLETDNDEATTTVTILDEVACPRFVGREVYGITVGTSPYRMRARLTAAGVRPINNVVDASNYAMIEFGHPTHAFDRTRLGDTIVVRRANDGEQVVTLDDVTRSLQTSDIVVADAERPVAIAGIMGGADTEVGDATDSALIEAAYWQPSSVLLTSKRFDLRSEASARFERGMDIEACRHAADRVAELLVAHAGATIGGVVDAYPAPPTPVVIELELSEIERLLGVTVESRRATDLLTRLGFGVEGSDPLTVTVPTRRPDVGRPADLVEEIARLYGFENIPSRLRMGTGRGLPVTERRLRKLRSVMVGAGYHEALNFSFIGAADLDRLGLPESDEARDGIRVVNPLREEEGVMRTTMLPGLLRAASLNVSRRIEDVQIFEIGKVFLHGSGKLPDQPDRLGFVGAGVRTAGWGRTGSGYDVYDATGLWETIAAAMDLPEPAVHPVQRAPFHPGRAAAVTIGGDMVGIVGEVDPAVVRAVGLDGRVIAGEIDVAPLVIDRGPWVFEVPSPYPPQIFDLAFEVDEQVPAAKILDAINDTAGDMLERLVVFDVYAGESLDEGRKSIAVNLTFRAPDRTLSDEETAPLRRSIVAAVESASGGELRGVL
ncbi:MAG: phenylalanine--tRNA ligase subunit beta [Acidimicrobiia bacterium]|nr:MAG: phenylalanine--tRNA ligase subunit beta [Acidimicrobiia bacterium]